eukprot:Pgem_evm1s14558
MPSVAISPYIKQGINPETTYENTLLIGDGSFGEVFRANLKDTGDVVAVKIVKIQNDDELEEFQIEIDILQ